MKIILNIWPLFMMLNVSAQQDGVNKNKVAEYFQNEQYKEAVEYLSPLLKDTPDLYVANSLGYAFLMNEETERAESLFGQAIKLDSLNFTANKYLAQIENGRDNLEQALLHYQRMIKVQPGNASLHKSIGDLFLSLKMPDSTLVFYAKAFQLQPSSIKYAANYATHLLNQKQYNSADSIVRIFLSIDSASTPVMMLAIRSAYEKENYKLAASFSDRWLNTNLDNMNLPTTIRLAIANYEIRNFSVGYKLCDTLIQQGIADERLLYHAARSLNKLGRHKESNDVLAQCLAIAISKNAEKYFFEAAENFESLRQYKAAIAACDTAYYLFRNPLALYNIGRLYENGLKNKEKAIAYYRQYLKKATPSTPEEKKAYAYLKELVTPTKNSR
jgi:tetratricopeptide (TPR) repeat protein